MTKKNGDNTDLVKEELPVKASKKNAPKSSAKDAKVASEDLVTDNEEVEELSVQRIYVGPGRPGLITNTVYSDGYPIFVSEMIEECPSIEKLMVKIADYSTAKVRVGEKGTVENTNAQKILDYYKGKGGNK